jgi:hypothetical protein
MKTLTFTAIAGFFAVVLAGTVTWQARAGGELVKFPEEYAKGQLYGSVDRTDIKEYREFYTSQAALDAVKKGQPIPSGTVTPWCTTKPSSTDRACP